MIDGDLGILVLLVVAFTGGTIVGTGVGEEKQEHKTIQQCKDYGRSRLGDVVIKCEIVQGEETVEGSK